METVIKHLCDDNFIYAVSAKVHDNENIGDVEDSRWEFVAKISRKRIFTKEGFKDWKRMIAAHEANMMRYDGYRIDRDELESE